MKKDLEDILSILWSIVVISFSLIMTPLMLLTTFFVNSKKIFGTFFKVLTDIIFFPVSFILGRRR